MRITAATILTEIKIRGDIKTKNGAQRFFKASKPGDPKTDQFLGIRVPVIRQLAKHFQPISTTENLKLLKSPFHEARLLALIIFTYQYAARSTTQKERTSIFQAYLSHTHFVNNWDLVDTSAHKIVGQHLLTSKDRSILTQLAHSTDIWERRIAIVSTWTFIRAGQLKDTLQLAEQLLSDPEDLIHKAVGWMLRELGKRDKPCLDSFLQKHAPIMPRTMLRYAIEKHPEPERQTYLRRPLTKMHLS